MAAGVADVLVVDEACGKREESECDADADACDGPSAVAFEGELGSAPDLVDSRG